MPGRDGRGPLGQGPMSGRGMGYCGVEVPSNAPFAGGRLGRGFGRGRGFGGGRGRGFFASGLPGWMRWAGYAAPYVGGYLASRLAPEPELEKQALKNEVEALQGELEFLKQRLAEIEGEAETK